MQAYKKKGFWVGLSLFVLFNLLPPPSGLSEAGWIVASVTVLMAAWWATEAVPVAVTALLPLVLFPLLGVADIKTTALPYANPNVYLFMGGFILALGIEEATEAQTASPIGSSNNVVEVFITHILIRAETSMKPPTNFAPLLPTRTSICNARHVK